MRFDLSLQNFKKSLVDIFSPAVGCRKKALSNFLASSSSLKTANTGKKLNLGFIFISIKTQDS